MRFTERPIKCFFSFFCWYPYSLSSAIPYKRPNLHSYHHERIPPFQFTVTNVHHFECCAYFTLFICNIYGWRSCTWKCIKWCIEPPTPSPRSVYAFFSKLVTSLSCIIEEKTTFDGWPCHTIFEVVVHWLVLI